jgi:glycosyltransferase involved in cell wall biosynthesis
MKIAVNTRLLVPDKMDGIGWFTYETLKRITQAHPEHEFLFIFDRKYDDAFIFGKNVTGHIIYPQARHPIIWLYWFEIALKRKLKALNADVFLSPEGWLPKLKSINSVAVIHDLNFEHHPENIIRSHRSFFLHFFPIYAKRATRIATVSEYSKNDISSTYGIQRSDIDVVYNGANERYAPIKPEEKKIIKETYSFGKDYFLFVGTLHPRKNLEHLFLAYEAYRLETKSDKKLIICGNKKWWPKQLESTFQSLQFKNDILLLGRMSNDELFKLTAAAFCMTYVPQFEGFGIPIIEAMKSGTPVITSNTSSMPEVSGDAALLADPFSPADIAKQMVRIDRDEQLWQELSTKGMKRAEEFSWDKTAELLWSCIEKVMSK